MILDLPVGGRDALAEASPAAASPPASSPTGPAGSAFARDVLAGLSAPRKTLPPKYFYDARGSALFEAITRLPEYYPTRTEFAILERYGAEMAAGIPAGAVLVEFGSGSSAKIRRLLAHAPALAAYVPVDVSAAFLRAEAEALRGDFPDLLVAPRAGDFTQAFALPPEVPGDAATYGFFPGSTIGNFDPLPAADLLRSIGATLGRGAAGLLVGVDLVKDAATLEAAYDDSEGVTAAFNLNLLARINRELGGTFDLDAFAHRALFDPRERRIEMHLVSRRAQTARVLDRAFRFAEGETIHTENSYKYDSGSFAALAARGGWSVARTWSDEAGLFAVHALVPGA